MVAAFNWLGMWIKWKVGEKIVWRRTWMWWRDDKNPAHYTVPIFGLLPHPPSAFPLFIPSSLPLSLSCLHERSRLQRASIPDSTRVCHPFLHGCHRNIRRACSSYRVRGSLDGMDNKRYTPLFLPSGYSAEFHTVALRWMYGFMYATNWNEEPCMHCHTNRDLLRLLIVFLLAT